MLRDFPNESESESDGPLLDCTMDVCDLSLGSESAQDERAIVDWSVLIYNSQIQYFGVTIFPING